jgi:hypothetical protein
MWRTAAVAVLGAGLMLSSVGVASAATGTAPTHTGLVVTPTSPVAGQLVYLRAAVKPVTAGTAPSGSVQFLDGSLVLGTASLATGSNGIAHAVLIHQFPAGSHNLTAQYLGDNVYAGSTSSAKVEQVAKAPTTTTVSDTTTATRGRYNLITVEKAVEPSGTPPGAVTPGGTVTFIVDKSAPQTATLTGSRTHITVQLPAGSHTVKVTYPGDSNFTGSSGTLSFVSS